MHSELKSILPARQIDEARVHLVRSLTASPPFGTSFHLVTPGPDVIVPSTDHTQSPAVLKAFQGIADKIIPPHCPTPVPVLTGSGAAGAKANS